MQNKREEEEEDEEEVEKAENDCVVQLCNVKSSPSARHISRWPV